MTFPRVEQRMADLNHRQEATLQLHSELFAKIKQAEIQLNLGRCRQDPAMTSIPCSRTDRG